MCKLYRISGSTDYKNVSKMQCCLLIYIIKLTLVTKEYNKLKIFFFNPPKSFKFPKSTIIV